MRKFPVLNNYREKDDFRRPKDIPWRMIAPHENQAKLNHGQSLEELAKRGGLCDWEMLAVLENRKYKINEEAVIKLNKLIIEFCQKELVAYSIECAKKEWGDTFNDRVEAAKNLLIEGVKDKPTPEEKEK